MIHLVYEITFPAQDGRTARQAYHVEVDYGADIARFLNDPRVSYATAFSSSEVAEETKKNWNNALKLGGLLFFDDLDE